MSNVVTSSTVRSKLKTVKKGSMFDKKLQLIQNEAPDTLRDIDAMIEESRPKAISMINVKSTQLGFKEIALSKYTYNH